MYGCGSWTLKKAECQWIDTFKLCSWRILLKVPWTARRSYQPGLREINPEYLLEGVMLKLPNFGHLTQTADSLEKSLMLGRIEGRRRRGCQRMRQLDGITDTMDMNLGKLWEMVREREDACCSPCDSKELNVRQLGNWTTTYSQLIFGKGGKYTQ